jgi:hypothetical protein
MECNCFAQHGMPVYAEEVEFHREKQDTKCEGWKRLLGLIEEAAADKREEFNLVQEFWGVELEELRKIVTLPPTISKLKSVKRFSVGGTRLVRIPPEIGEMTNLEEFDTYMCHQLHWYPYELTRCKNLTRSTLSTRSVYGNFKHRPPFPKLQPGRDSTKDLDLNNMNPEIWGAVSIRTCSVCDKPLVNSGLHQVWISLPVGTDVRPLLVNACSDACIQKLPKPPENYVQEPHKGGLDIEQPPARYSL